MRHLLSNVDLEVRSADCDVCQGRVRVRVRKDNIHCDRVLRAEVPERRSRSHYLTNIDPVAKTADCLQCGPTTVRPQTNNGMTPWRCEYRAKQSNDWNSKYEHPDPHVRLQMKLDHGLFCDLCGTETQEEHAGNTLNYDHDHDTGWFRGWLCPDCNKGIGLLKDNPALLRGAAYYLEQHAEDMADRLQPLPGVYEIISLI